MKKFFADTSYWIALLNPGDNLHGKVQQVSSNLGDCRIITSEMVMVELLDGLAKYGEQLRKKAVETVESLKSNPNVKVVPQTSIQFTEAMKYYVERPDKQWGLTDCSSFVIMDDESINEALTYDEHFSQAGFVALLR